MELNDFFKNITHEDAKELESGLGIKEDVKRWIVSYRNYLNDSGKSKKTSDNYDVVLNAFEKYISRYCGSLSGIGLLSIDSHINDFLSYMEEYQVSKEYGSLKERIDRLIGFINSYTIKTVDEFESAIPSYFTDMDDDVVDINEYVLKDFLAYLKKKNIFEIEKVSVSGYIETRPRVKTDTMIQRRIAIIAFLKFIDRSIGYDKFESELWRVKQYRKTKEFNQLKTGFDVSDQKKISTLLSKPPSKTVMGMKKAKRNSEYVEWRTRAMMVLMMRSGLRTTEALGLKYSDIIESKDKKTYFLEVLGKGNKIRRVPISKSIFEPYLVYLRENQIGEYLSSTSRRGLPQNRSNLYTMIKARLKKAGVSQYGLHIFRHHFGSSFASENGNIKVLQQLLGHSSIKTTMIYSEIDDNELARHVSSLSHYQSNAYEYGDDELEKILDENEDEYMAIIGSED